MTRRVYLIALATLLWGCVSPDTGIAAELVAVQSPTEAARAGSCETNGRGVAIGNAVRLENRSIERRGDGATVRISLGPQRVSLEHLGRGTDGTTSIFDVRSIISSGEGLDVELQFVLVGEILAVYWRETYQYRSYRQGLLRIDGAHVAPWCEGRGGFDISH